MVLGKLPEPGRPTIWIIVGQGPIALAVGAGMGCLDIFTLLYLFSLLSPSLWETARYRLKYCLKGPLSPKQPTNLISAFPFTLQKQIKRVSVVKAVIFLRYKRTIFIVRYVSCNHSGNAQTTRCKNGKIRLLNLLHAMGLCHDGWLVVLGLTAL